MRDYSIVRWESANKIYGRTLNPYDINRIAGGSSGGEGCLLASLSINFCKILLIDVDLK